MADSPKRNDPCHCGSGRKYKNCCIEKDESKLSSNLGVAGLIVVVLLGIWFLASNFSAGDGNPDCPTGTTWSQSHQHCH
ncbi:SEC-C metal-binding domain-containing protein [Gracilimonas sp.]|uniref:SEC-C metal-binding domain-containing protein n=1 Tax=Gracilimonas sp. TaxID=1974203 RepID=UPI002871061B|nr:SEC-C metal-binding domain-containing protein [Gracilimonas sp.]